MNTQNQIQKNAKKHLNCMMCGKVLNIDPALEQFMEDRNWDIAKDIKIFCKPCGSNVKGVLNWLGNE
jgi:ribosomal protein L37E